MKELPAYRSIGERDSYFGSSNPLAARIETSRRTEVPGTIEAVTSDFAVATGGISYRTDGTPHVQSVAIDVAEAPSKPSMSECETEGTGWSSDFC